MESKNYLEKASHPKPWLTVSWAGEGILAAFLSVVPTARSGHLGRAPLFSAAGRVSWIPAQPFS